jgi:hypothetical protein
MEIRYLLVCRVINIYQSFLRNCYLKLWDKPLRTQDALRPLDQPVLSSYRALSGLLTKLGTGETSVRTKTGATGESVGAV